MIKIVHPRFPDTVWYVNTTLEAIELLIRLKLESDKDARH